MRWTVLLFALPGFVGCAQPVGKDASSKRWQGIKAEIRRKFPHVDHWSTQQVQRAVAAGGVVLVDVRAPAEFAVSHLAGAQNLTADFDTALVAHKDDPVVVYCSVGYRSAYAADALRKAGFTHVHNYLGSIFEWANEGLPLVDAAGPTTKVHPYDADWGRLLTTTRR